MSTNDNRTATAVCSDAPPRRRFRADTALSAIVATALATAAALGTSAPALAQTASTTTSTTTQTGHLWVYPDNGFGGGTVTSSPAGINCQQAPGTDVYGPNPQPDPTGACDATYPVGTHVALTATAIPGDYINYVDPPNPSCNYQKVSCNTTVVIVQGYNEADVMFCPDNDVCSDG